MAVIELQNNYAIIIKDSGITLAKNYTETNENGKVKATFETVCYPASVESAINSYMRHALIDRDYRGTLTGYIDELKKLKDEVFKLSIIQ
jgi:hypothetical protein